MPIYEFKCLSCGAKFEKILPARHKDAPMRCPWCNREAERVISVVNHIWKEKPS